MKKTLIAFFMLSFIVLYTLNINSVNASFGGQEVEATFEYECGLVPVGMEPTLFPSTVTFKATVPDKVGKGKEFYLTNTSIIVTLPFVHSPGAPPADAAFESPNFSIIYGSDNSQIQIFASDVDFVIPPGANYDHKVLIVDGVEVGPIVTDDDGEITLKAGDIKANFVIDAGLPVPLTLSFVCYVPDNQEFSFASIPIDSEEPVITLKGDNPMIVKQGDPYVEPGATAQDNFDGDVSDKIEISGDVDTSTIGTYTVTYTVSDSVGNVATAERTVNVVEPFGNWYTGEGPPSDELGNNGDSYLDVTTGDVYKRDPNTWTKVGNIKGNDGKQGSAIHTGSGAPNANVGDVGDLYLDTKTGDVYEKTADGWVKIANLQGPAGPQGPQGPKGSDGTSGDNNVNGDSRGTKSSGTSTGDGDSKGSSAKGGKLPKTATSLPTLILVGAMLVIAGGVLFLKRKKAFE